MSFKGQNRDLLRRARSNEGVPQRRALERGLMLELAQARNGDVVVILERRDQWPTDADFEKVLEHWPEPVPAGVVPLRHKVGKTYRLIARWPRPLETEPIAEAAA